MTFLIVASLYLLPAVTVTSQGVAVYNRFSGVPFGSCYPSYHAVNDTNGDFYDCLLGAWHKVSSGGGGGTVTSFSAGSLSPLFTTSVATPTTTPALSFTLTSAPADSIFGNFSGSSGPPSYQTGTIPSSLLPQFPQTIAAVSHEWLNSYTASTGLFTQTQPAFTDISGTVSDSQLANAYSGVGSCSSHNWINALTRNAAPTCSQPVFTDISGVATTAQLPFTYTGNTTELATWTGATTASNCVHTDASGNLEITGSDCGSAGGSVSVNGSAVSSPNFNGTTPAAQNGYCLNTYQVSSSSVSSEFQFGLNPLDCIPSSSTAYSDEFNGSALAAQWTKVNFGGTATVANGYLQINLPSTSGTSKNIIEETAPSCPYTIVTRWFIDANYANFFDGGIVLSDSSGKLITWGPEFNTGASPNSAGMTERLGTFTSPTAAASSQTFAGNPWVASRYLWVNDDCTNLNFKVSTDKMAWTAVVGAVSRTAFLTSGPTLIGVFMEDLQGVSALNAQIDFDYFRVCTTSACTP